MTHLQIVYVQCATVFLWILRLQIHSFGTKVDVVEEQTDARGGGLSPCPPRTQTGKVPGTGPGVVDHGSGVGPTNRRAPTRLQTLRYTTCSVALLPVRWRGKNPRTTRAPSTRVRSHRNVFDPSLHTDSRFLVIWVGRAPHCGDLGGTALPTSRRPVSSEFEDQTLASATTTTS